MKKVLSIILVVAFVVLMTFAGYGCKAEEEAVVEEEAVAEEEAVVEEEAVAEEEAVVEEAFDPADYPLAVITFLTSHPVLQIMIAGFLDRAETLGYPAKVYGPTSSDVAETVAQGEIALAEGVKGLAMFIVDESVKPFFRRAAGQGVAVVSAHTVINLDEYSGCLAYAAPDPYLMGVNAAFAIAEEIGGEGKIAITQGAFIPNENALAQGLIDTIADNYPDIEVLDPIEEGFDPSEAAARATAIIQAHPDLSGALSTTGAGPSTWSNAMKQTGKDDIIAIGMDYSRQNLDLVKEGKVYGIIAQPLFKEWEEAVNKLDKILRGEPYEAETIIDAPIVTIENLDPYYDLIDKVEAVFAEK